MLKLIKTTSGFESTKRCWHNVAAMLDAFEREDESIMEVTGIDDYPSVYHAYESIWVSIYKHKRNKSIGVRKRKEHIYLVKLI